jgi:hypothetical protein
VRTRIQTVKETSTAAQPELTKKTRTAPCVFFV